MEKLLPFKKPTRGETVLWIRLFYNTKAGNPTISLIIIVATLISVLLPYQYLHYIWS
jgi:hypothetical protein